MFLAAEESPRPDRRRVRLNEGGGGQIKSGRKIVNEVQAAEKHYATFVLEVTNKAGTARCPRKGQRDLPAGAGRLEAVDYEFPVHLTEVTRGVLRADGSESSAARTART